MAVARASTVQEPSSRAARPIGRRPLALALGLLAVAGVAAAGVLVLAWPGRGAEPVVAAPAPLVVRVGEEPAGLVALPGRLWVAAQRAGQVVAVDPATGRAREIVRTGGAPSRIARGASGVWVADGARATVVGVQLDPRRIFAPVRMGADVGDLELVARAVWTTSSAEGVVRYLEPGASTPARLRVGRRPLGLGTDGRWLVVANAGDGTITRIDAARRATVGAPIRTGSTPVDVAVAGGAAWVANAGDGTAARVDLRTGALTLSGVGVCSRPVAIAADERDAYVLCAGDRALVRLDARTGRPRGRARVGPAPTALALQRDRVWVASAGDDRVVGLAR